MSNQRKQCGLGNELRMAVATKQSLDDLRSGRFNPKGSTYQTRKQYYDRAGKTDKTTEAADQDLIAAYLAK